MSTDASIEAVVKAYSLDAIDHARQAAGSRLDFSTDSVESVENVLALMYDTKPKKSLLDRLLRRPSADDMIWLFAKMYGAYIGEVLRQNYGGEWHYDPRIRPGALVPALKKGDSIIWPSIKVGKRLTNGPEDNVWHYFYVIQRRW